MAADPTSSSRPRTSLTDDEIMNAAIGAADALDATRVSEMTPKGWRATTIFDGNTGLLRLGRMVEKAVLEKLTPSETECSACEAKERELVTARAAANVWKEENTRLRVGSAVASAAFAEIEELPRVNGEFVSLDKVMDILTNGPAENCRECGGLGHSSEVAGMKCPHCGGDGKAFTSSATAFRGEPEICHATSSSGSWTALARHCYTCGASAKHGERMTCLHATGTNDRG